MIRLHLKQIEDRYLRENFERIQRLFQESPILDGDFKFYEFTIDEATEGYEFYHNLGFFPNDIIITKAIGDTYEIDYEATSDEYIVINTSGPLYIRCFIGNMKGDEITGSGASAPYTAPVSE